MASFIDLEYQFSLKKYFIDEHSYMVPDSTVSYVHHGISPD
jgi:hypothetical protein